MKHTLLFLIISFFSINSLASQPLEVSLLKVVTGSDHVLTAHVIGVDMIDEKGLPLTDSRDFTGPSNNNLIRLICEVKTIHRTTMDSVPKTIKIPLDGFMYYTLGQIKKAYSIPGHTYSMVVVLKGQKFEPAYEGLFQYPEYELETLLALYDLKNQ